MRTLFSLAILTTLTGCDLLFFQMEPPESRPFYYEHYHSHFANQCEFTINLIPVGAAANSPSHYKIEPGGSVFSHYPVKENFVIQVIQNGEIMAGKQAYQQAAPVMTYLSKKGVHHFYYTAFCGKEDYFKRVCSNEKCKKVQFLDTENSAPEELRE